MKMNLKSIRFFLTLTLCAFAFCLITNVETKAQDEKQNRKQIAKQAKREAEAQGQIEAGQIEAGQIEAGIEGQVW